MNDKQAAELLIKYSNGMFDPDSDHLSLEIIEAVKAAYELGYQQCHLDTGE